MQQPVLTEDDKKLLRQELKTTTTFQIIITVVIATMIGVAVGNSVFNWWKEIVTQLLGFFSAFFFILWAINFKRAFDIQRDINENSKKVISGTVQSKKIGRRKEEYFFENSYLGEIADYQENQKAGVKKDYGNHEVSLSQHARLPFYIFFPDEKEPYSVSAKNYLLVEAGDTVVMEVSPRSKVVLRFAKA